MGEALLSLTRRSEAEEFLLRAKAKGGVAPKRVSYVVYTTSFAASTGGVDQKTERIRQILGARGINFTEHDLHENPELKQSMESQSGSAELPQVFIDGKYLEGGFEELQLMHDSDE